MATLFLLRRLQLPWKYGQCLVVRYREIDESKKHPDLENLYLPTWRRKYGTHRPLAYLGKNRKATLGLLLSLMLLRPLSRCCLRAFQETQTQRRFSRTVAIAIARCPPESEEGSVRATILPLCLARGTRRRWWFLVRTKHTGQNFTTTLVSLVTQLGCKAGLSLFSRSVDRNATGKQSTRHCTVQCEYCSAQSGRTLSSRKALCFIYHTENTLWI